MRKTTFATLFAIAILIVPSLATPGEAEEQAVRELCGLVMPKAGFIAMMDAMFKQMSGSVPDEGAEKLARIVHDLVTYEEMQQWMVAIYSPRFSLEEIKALGAFYKTPLGRKLAKLTPEISGELSQRMVSTVMQRLPAAMQKAGIAP